MLHLALHSAAKSGVSIDGLAMLVGSLSTADAMTREAILAHVATLLAMPPERRAAIFTLAGPAPSSGG